MPVTVSIGCQDFETIRTEGYFYIDKSHFIREWWGGGDSVTLITRPGRFGKTLAISMAEKFFSVEYAGRHDLFEGLDIWREETYRRLQGTYPVVALSFAGIKETTFSDAKKKVCRLIQRLYNRYDFLPGGSLLNENEKHMYRAAAAEMSERMVSDSLNVLSDYLSRYYGKKVIILLDEYDTPMHEAYVHGYWDELSDFKRRSRSVKVRWFCRENI